MMMKRFFNAHKARHTIFAVLLLLAGVVPVKAQYNSINVDVPTTTAMTAALPDEIRQEWVKKIPLRRGGQVEDIANVATFLASDLSSYVTGQVIQVDGGMNM